MMRPRKPSFRRSQRPSLGSWVRVRGYPSVARIERFYGDVEGGVLLDRPVAGFRSWNLDALVPVPINPVSSGKHPPAI